SPAPAILGSGYDRAPTRTAEFRALSPRFDGILGLDDLFGLDFGDSDLLVGVFTQKSAIEDGYFDFVLPLVAFADLTAAAEASGNSDSDPPLLSDILGLVPPSELFLEEGVVESVRQYFNQHSDTRALFAQLQWRFLPQWTVQLAGRYSEEQKDAWWNSVFTSTTGVVLGAAGFTEFTAMREREDSFFQPRVSLNWQPVGSLSLFAHWARAFKSGGFNAFSFRNSDDQLTYRPEYTSEWGADIKGTFFNRRLKLNLSAYRMTVDDFQVLIRQPQAGVIGLGLSKVSNAAQAQAQGIEGDVTWLMASWLRWFVTVGYNDTEYLNFPNNECPPDRDNQDGDDNPL
ncbi:MAG: TonB-dependent receptor domain-containing protein, partial [Solimonas sp.]